MKLLIKIREKLNIRFRVIKTKLLVQRTLGYLSIFNSGMILFIFLSNFEQQIGHDINIKQLYFPIFGITMLLFLIFGFAEDKLGFYREEVNQANQRNPQITEINERLKRMEKKMDGDIDV